MDLHQQYLTKNNCYKFGKTIKPVGIMVHSTGANTPTLRRYVQPDDDILGNNPYGMRWIQPTPNEQAVCVRAFIGLAVAGDVAACQTLPWTYCGWHSGRSSTSSLGCIRGTGTGKKGPDERPADLDLSNDMDRLLVLLDRAEAFLT